ncbi:MAG: RHS repeat-associated core domain-containing protein, partial [Verrucomicrobiota bacterium]
NWKTTYDGLGRRLQTSYCDATGNQTTSGALAINYYYDPEVEFLELGRDYFGRTWNLYGPDRSGTYGGAQGVGGLVATTAEGHDEVHGVVNNIFGDILGTTTGGVFNSWGNVLGGYGAMPGSSVNADLVPQWRSHYLDWTGFYYMGTRYYEPKSGRFLSPDPLGHDASLSLYDYCDGDPVNGLDPDGRCGKAAINAEVHEMTEGPGFIGDRFGIEALSNYRDNVNYMANKGLYEAPDFETGFNTFNGIGISIASLDAFNRYTTPDGYKSQHGSMPKAFSGSGIFSDFNDAFTMRSSVADSLGLNKEDVFSIQNPTHGGGDFIRAWGQQSGFIDITAARASDMINAAGGGHVILHSNAAGLFYAASPYLRPEVRANIYYQGYGPQVHISQRNVPGLHSYYNEIGSGDLIIQFSNFGNNVYWDKVISQDAFHFLNNHSFRNTYSPDVHP